MRNTIALSLSQPELRRCVQLVAIWPRNGPRGARTLGWCRSSLAHSVPNVELQSELRWVWVLQCTPGARRNFYLLYIISHAKLCDFSRISRLPDCLFLPVLPAETGFRQDNCFFFRHFSLLAKIYVANFPKYTWYCGRVCGKHLFIPRWIIRDKDT